MQPHAERAGSDQALLRLVRSLPRDEFDFHIVVPAVSPLADEYASAGATMHVVPMDRLSTSHRAGEWAKYALGWPVAVYRLVQLIRGLDVDVVHSNSLHSLYGWAAAFLTRRPHVWHAREIVVQSPAALRVERFLCKHFAVEVIAVSHAVAAQFDPANVVVIDDCLDPGVFRPDRAGRFRDEVGVPDDAPVVGSVARLVPVKGVDTLVDAFTTVREARPDARLVVVGAAGAGQEAYAQTLRDRMARAPGVTLLDERDDIPDVMADFDVLALPSSEPDPLPLVLVEALVTGVPVVSTDIGGPPELVARAEPGAGRLVGPGDATALAHALLELLPASTSAPSRRARHPLVELRPPGFADAFRAAVSRRR